MNRHEINLQSAIALARKVEHDNCWHLAALLMRSHRVISYGWNSYTTHPKSNTKYKFCHAEFDAILGVDADKLRNATLYVARVGYDGRAKILFAKPCSHCQELIMRANIKYAYYTVDDYSYAKWDVRQYITTIYNYGGV